jgi:hypothetical protein
MQTFSLNALAESFEVDRSTMVRAMRGVAPDLVKSGNRPTWKTATAARALEARRRKQDSGNSGAGPTHQFANQIEAEFETFDAGFTRLKAEPDLERRRKLDERLGVGRIIGGLDRRMKEANAVLGEGEGLFAFVGDHLIGDLISNYLTLLDYWPDDAEIERLRAGGAARRAAYDIVADLFAHRLEVIAAEAATALRQAATPRDCSTRSWILAAMR